MGDTNELIDALRGQGQVAARGHFTLDAEKAREKMRMFQLADPHRYVLLLLQALVARGAQRIAIDIDTDDLRIVSDARPFEQAELADIYGVVLGETQPAPGLRELALGLNAALALNPRWLRLEASAGGAGVRLEQRPELPDRLEQLEACEAGVRLHVKERFRPGLIARFFRVGSDVLREQVLLRSHCRLSAIEITLGGQRLQQLERDPTVPHWHRVELAGRWAGRVGLSSEGGEGKVELVRHEIWMSTHTFEQPAFSGVRAVLDVTDLRTDVSMAEVVRDEAYEALLAQLQRTLDPVISAACAAFERGQLPPWLGLHIAARIAERGVVHPLSPAMTAWLGARLWSTLDGKAVSTAELFARPRVAFSRERPDEVPTDVAGVIDGQHGAADRLKAIIGDVCRDDTKMVERAVKRLLSRQAFKSRRYPAALPADVAYSARVEITGPAGAIGELAIHGDSRERGWIRIVLEGCLLVELEVKFPIARVHAVITAKLAPSELYDDVQRNESFAAAMFATLVAYDRAVQLLAAERGEALDDATREDLCRHLAAMQTDKGPAEWLGALEIPPRAVQKLLRARGRPWRLLGDDLVEGCPNLLGRAPLFEDAAGAPLDLVAIAERIRAEGKLRVVAKGRPRLANMPELVVRADEKRLELLKAIFGGRAIERAGRDFDRWLARDAFLAITPVAELALPRPCRLGPLPLQLVGAPALTGIAVEPETDPIGERALVQLVTERRPLATVRPACGLTGVQLAFDVDPCWVNPKYDGIAGEAAAAGVDAALATAVGVLADGIVGGESLAERGSFVVELAALVWPAPTWLQAWQALRRELGEVDGARHYAELLRLGDRHTPEELRAALRGYLDQSVTPMPERVAPMLKTTVTPPRNLGAQAIAALERAARWTTIACLPTCGRAQRSIADLLAMVAAKQRIPFVATVEPAAGADVLVLATEIADRLAAILGADALQNVAPALRLQAQRVAFEERPERAGLGLGDEQVLVYVEVDHDGLTGVLALPRWLPGEAPGCVTICHRKREFTSVDPLEGTPLIGVLDGHGLGAASGFVALADAELARVRACCSAHRDELLRALSRQREALAGDAWLVAAWARHLLPLLVPGSRATHVALAAAGVDELADLPLFVDSQGGPVTLAMLRAELDTRGDIAVVSETGLRLDRRLVHARNETELGQLRTIFGAVTNCDARARTRAQLERERQSAPPLPEPGPDAFAVVELDERELIGKLWLDPSVDDETTVCLGIDGRAVDRRRPSKTFPCAGAVGGAGVELDPDRGRCRLSGQRASLLSSRAALLYQQTLASVREAMPPADDPRARVLARLLLRLHTIAVADAGWPSGEQRRFYRDLRELPLLALPNGRAISLDVALRERPIALAQLGLWTPESPEPDDGGTVAVVEVDDAGDAVIPPPSPVPAPVIAPPPPPPPPELVLAQLVRDELRLIRDRDQTLFAELYLERIHVAARGGKLVAQHDEGSAVLDASHPVVRAALAQPDPLLVSLLASAAFTVLNVAHEALTDEQEARVLAQHAAYLRTATPRRRG